MTRTASSGVHKQASHQTREAILEAARELFARKGYAGTTVRAIAARLELTDPAIYYHFHSKRNLWENVLDSASVQAPALPAESDPEEVTDWLIDFFFAYVEQAGLVRMLLREQFGSDPPSRAFRERSLGTYHVAAIGLLRTTYGERARPILDALTCLLSGIIWDGVLAYGDAFTDVARQPAFKARVRDLVRLTLGTSCGQTEH